MSDAQEQPAPDAASAEDAAEADEDEATVPSPALWLTVLYDGYKRTVRILSHEYVGVLIFRLRIVFQLTHDKRPYGLWLLSAAPGAPWPLLDASRQVAETPLCTGHTLMLAPLPPQATRPLC